jgi:hypothetical protein
MPRLTTQQDTWWFDREKRDHSGRREVQVSDNYHRDREKDTDRLDREDYPQAPRLSS